MTRDWFYLTAKTLLIMLIFCLNTEKETPSLFIEVKIEPNTRFHCMNTEKATFKLFVIVKIGLKN